MSDEPEQRNWLELPRDVTASILSRLGAFDVLESVQKVCLLWREICKDPSMWRFIDMQNKGFFLDMDPELVKMCMHAIDRSKGDAVDINIESFCSDELLSYIAQRIKSLRRLRLVGCFSISDDGLVEVASKFPNLEELELTFCGSLSEDVLADVGRCCPNLKTFKLNKKVYKYERRDFEDVLDLEAEAIAQNMHELRHLQLFGNMISNRGLRAILDGCPHLEYLDLRMCSNVSLEGDLEKRCAQQIKHLRRPDDSTEDYEFKPTWGDSDAEGSGTSDGDYDDYPYYYSNEFQFLNEYPFDYDDIFEEYLRENH